MPSDCGRPSRRNLLASLADGVHRSSAALPLLTGPNLWAMCTDPKKVSRDGDMVLMVLPISARMLVIYRTTAELFTTTIANSFKKLPFVCAINGIQYSISTGGYAAAMLGNPDDASATTPEGMLVNQGKILGGRSAPKMFYMVNDPLGVYDFGEGDPPQVGMSGVGGVGPIIINGLPYGIGNRCQMPAACAPTGPIAPQYADSVEQRNNATYAANRARRPRRERPSSRRTRKPASC
jgi:hypothetical protein